MIDGSATTKTANTLSGGTRGSFQARGMGVHRACLSTVWVKYIDCLCTVWVKYIDLVSLGSFQARLH